MRLLSRSAAIPSVVAATLLLGLLTSVGWVKSTEELAPEAASPSADLALVPADAVVFAHIHLAEVWKSEFFSGIRNAVLKAGTKELAVLQDLTPPPSTFDRATSFVLLSGGQPEVFGILSFNKPVNAEELVKSYFPKFEKKTVSGKSLYVAEREIAFYFPTDKQMMVGSPEGFAQYLKGPVAKEGAMKPALELAATRPFVVSGNISALPIPAEAFREVPPEILPLLKMQTLTLSIQLQGDPTLHLAGTYKDAAAMADAEKALAAGQKLAKAYTAKARASHEKELFPAKGTRKPNEYPLVVNSVLALGGLNTLDEMIDNPKIHKQGNSLAIDVTIPKEIGIMGGTYLMMAYGALVPTAQRMRESAAQTQGKNNLKQLAVAMHNYVSTTNDANTLPATAICDKAGKPLLSWRVKLLPQLEQQQLYNQFKLDEPWDSEHNKPLLAKMPRLFVAPLVAAKPGYTYYKMFSGPDTYCDVNRGGKLTATDGASQTILIVEGGTAVPWTKPEDIPYDPKKPLPPLAFPGTEVCFVAMGDGSVRRLDLRKVSEKSIRAAITANAADLIGADW